VAFVKITKFEDGVLKTVNATSDEIEFKGGKVNNDLTVEGNLVVKGASTVLYPESVNLSDNHLFLNSGYTTTSAQTGGLVVNYLPTSLTGSVDVGGFTAGVLGTSNPTVAVPSPASVTYTAASGVSSKGNVWTVSASPGADFATIQAALSSASVVDGDTISVASGTYTVSAKIVVAKQVAIIGDGIGSTIVQTNADGSAPTTMFEVTVSNVWFKGITFKHRLTSDPGGIGTAISFIGMAGQTGIRMQACRIEFIEFGVVVKCDSYEIYQCQFAYTGANNSTRRCIGIYRSAVQGLILNNTYASGQNGVVTGNTRFIQITSTVGLATEIIKGYLRIGYNTPADANPLHQFFNCDSFNVDSSALQLVIDNNSAAETSAFFVFAQGTAQPTLSQCSSIALVNNTLTNAHGKGAIALNGSSGTGGTLGTTSFIASGNTISSTAFLGTFVTAIDGGASASEGALMGYDTARWNDPNQTISAAGTPFSAGQFVQVSGAALDVNNGLFEVLSHLSGVLTIKGVGLTSCTEDFTQNQFTTDSTDQGTVTSINVAVLRAATSGDWQYSKGSASPLSYTGLTGGALLAANNLSDLEDASAARTNLGLGSAAESAASDFLSVASNLSDLNDASAARTNLGLGSAAESAASDFLAVASNLSDLNDASAARTNLGLGSAAESAASDFLAVASDLSDLNDASAARTNLGLGSAAVESVGTAAGNVVQLDVDAKLPAVDGSQLTGLAWVESTDVSLNDDTKKVVVGTGGLTVSQGSSIATSGWTTTGCAVGEVVYASGASTVSLADADNSSASKIIGVVSATGEIVHVGPCDFHVDAAGCSAGDRLYASPTAGRVTATPPSTTNQYVAPIGLALASIAANGTGRGIFMREPAVLLS
jgi:hypothetical protein